MLNAIHPSPMAVNGSAVDVNKQYSQLFFSLAVSSLTDNVISSHEITHHDIVQSILTAEGSQK